MIRTNYWLPTTTSISTTRRSYRRSYRIIMGMTAIIKILISNLRTADGALHIFTHTVMTIRHLIGLMACSAFCHTLRAGFFICFYISFT